MKETTYKVYLDTYGHLIGIEIVEDVKNYVFVTGYETFNSVLSNAKAEAFAIFMDGTAETITVKDAAKTKEGDNQTAWNADNGNEKLNSWYTYKTDKNGYYTLEPVAQNITGDVKVAQGWDQTNDKELNKNHVSLKDTAGDKNHAYANDDTIFLTAKVKNVGKGEQITGVAAVATGIKNVNLKLDGTSNPEGAYFLYGKNGYIIAAVVVADDLAASSNYAYIIGSVSQEDYDSAEDVWTWHRSAVIDGKEVVLKEQGTSLTYLGAGNLNGNMQTYGWYKMSYDADGYVMGAEPVTDWDTGAGLDKDTIAVDHVVYFNNGISSAPANSSYDKEDVVLVRQNMTAGSTKLTLEGHTVYVSEDPTHDYGIDIMPDADAVLIYKKDGKDGKKAFFNEESGNVAAAIKMMESDDFNGVVYFVMKDGVATSVIIKCTDNWTTKDAEGTTPIITDVAKVEISTATTTVTLTLAAGKTAITPAAAKVAAGVALEDDGYVVTGWNGMAVTATKAGLSANSEVTFNVVVYQADGTTAVDPA